VIASAVPRGHNLLNETARQHYLWNDSINTHFMNSISNGNNHNNNDSFDRPYSDIDDPFEDMDFAPISIDDHQEQNDDVMKTFEL